MTVTLSPRHPAFLLLSLSFLLFVPGLASAQATGSYCEPSPVIKAELKKVSDVHNEDLPYSARLQRQKTMLQELISKYPDDYHVRRRYQDSRRAGFFADVDALIVDYRA